MWCGTNPDTRPTISKDGYVFILLWSNMWGQWYVSTVVSGAPSFYAFSCPFYSLLREIGIDGGKMSPLKLYLAVIVQSPNVRAYASLLEKDFIVSVGTLRGETSGSGVGRKVDKRASCPTEVFPCPCSTETRGNGWAVCSLFFIVFL